MNRPNRKRKRSLKQLLGLIIGLLAIILISYSVILPWWGIHLIDYEDDTEQVVSYGLLQVQYESPNLGIHFFRVFNNTLYLVLTALGLAIFSLAFYFMKSNKLLFKKLSSIIGLFSLVMMFLAIIYISVDLRWYDYDWRSISGGYSGTFWGSESTSTYITNEMLSWGPFLGWFLCLISIILMSLFWILATHDWLEEFYKKKDKDPSHVTQDLQPKSETELEIEHANDVR